MNANEEAVQCLTFYLDPTNIVTITSLTSQTGSGNSAICLRVAHYPKRWSSAVLSIYTRGESVNEEAVLWLPDPQHWPDCCYHFACNVSDPMQTCKVSDIHRPSARIWASEKPLSAAGQVVSFAGVFWDVTQSKSFDRYICSCLDRKISWHRNGRLGVFHGWTRAVTTRFLSRQCPGKIVFPSSLFC